MNSKLWLRRHVVTHLLVLRHYTTSHHVMLLVVGALERIAFTSTLYPPSIGRNHFKRTIRHFTAERKVGDRDAHEWSEGKAPSIQ